MEIQHDESKGQFFIDLDGDQRAALSYRKAGDDVLNFYSVFVPPEGRGKGVAAKLVIHGFEYAREHNMRVRPTCPYVSGAFLKRYPQYADDVE